MSENTKGRMEIESRPAHSPHRAMLNLVDASGAFPVRHQVYWIQESKTGAGRGDTPRWLGFDGRDVEIMRRLVACWNACEGYATETLESGNAFAQRVPPLDRDELLEALREYHDAADANAEACRRILDGSGPIDAPARLRWIAAGKAARALLAKHAKVTA